MFDGHGDWSIVVGSANYQVSFGYNAVFVGDGKGSDSLEPFFKRLRRSGANIEAVAIDMSPAYITFSFSKRVKLLDYVYNYHTSRCST